MQRNLEAAGARTPPRVRRCPLPRDCARTRPDPRAPTRAQAAGGVSLMGLEAGDKPQNPFSPRPAARQAVAQLQGQARARNPFSPRPT